jgi:hypothetical protein
MSLSRHWRFILQTFGLTLHRTVAGCQCLWGTNILRATYPYLYRAVICSRKWKTRNHYVIVYFSNTYSWTCLNAVPRGLKVCYMERKNIIHVHFRGKRRTNNLTTRNHNNSNLFQISACVLKERSFFFPPSLKFLEQTRPDHDLRGICAYTESYFHRPWLWQFTTIGKTLGRLNVMCKNVWSGSSRISARGAPYMSVICFWRSH